MPLLDTYIDVSVLRILIVTTVRNNNDNKSHEKLVIMYFRKIRIGV